MKKLLKSLSTSVLGLLLTLSAGCVRTDSPRTGVLREVKIVGSKMHSQVSISGEVANKYELCLDERIGRPANELEIEAQESCPLWVKSDEKQTTALVNQLKEHGLDSVFSITLKNGNIQSSEYLQSK